MGVIFLLVVGGIIGWLWAIMIRRDDWSGTARNMAFGIAGALLTGLVLAPALGGGNLLAGGYHVSALLSSLLGAIAMLAGVNVLRRDHHSAEGTQRTNAGR